MPPNLFGRLSRTGRAAFPKILAGIRRGLSDSDVQAELTSEFGRIGLRNISAIRADNNIREQYIRSFRAGSLSNPIDPDRIPISAGRQRNRFNHIFTLTGRNDMGALITKHITITTDDPDVSIDELMNEAEEIAGDGDDSYGINDAEVSYSTTIAG